MRFDSLLPYPTAGGKQSDQKALGCSDQSRKRRRATFEFSELARRADPRNVHELHQRLPAASVL